jgi:Domain of unknown function (DUF4430)
MNAQNALEAIVNDPANKNKFTFLLQFYGSTLGYLVDMINGTYDTMTTTGNTGQPYYFWDFLYNGSSSTKGIDSVLLQDNDTIGFNFEIYDPAQHTGTSLETKWNTKQGAVK